MASSSRPGSLPFLSNSFFPLWFHIWKKVANKKKFKKSKLFLSYALSKPCHAPIPLFYCWHKYLASLENFNSENFNVQVFVGENHFIFFYCPLRWYKYYNQVDIQLLFSHLMKKNITQKGFIIYIVLFRKFIDWWLPQTSKLTSLAQKTVFCK